MKETLEREVKLRPGPRFSPAPLSGREIAEQTFTSSYYDTDDLRLAAGSITLRRRDLEGSDAVWQLKLPRGDVVSSLSGRHRTCACRKRSPAS